MSDPTPNRREAPQRSLNVLYLCHRVPYPPDKGDKIRAFHQIRGLAARHRVHLLTFADSPEDLRAARGLEQYCTRVEVFRLGRAAGYLRAGLAALGSRPLTFAFFDSPALAARVRGLARAAEASGERFDVVVAYSAAMASYAELLPGVPKVLDLVDVDSAKWEQYARLERGPMRHVYALEARRLRASESDLARRFERLVLATANETQQLRAFAPHARAETVTNGVDLDVWTRLDLPRSTSPMLVFTGQMDYFANVDGVVNFARRVFPRLRRRFPDLELVVVGRSPAQAVKELGELPGVLVTGAVGDVRPFLARAWAFVAPLRIAQGVQNKVLEAMASGLPVVASERVVAGLADGGFRDGEDLLAAADDEAFEQAVARLLADRELRQRIAEGGRRRVQHAYRWQPNLDRFERLLAEVAERGVAGPTPMPPRPQQAPLAEEARSA